MREVKVGQQKRGLQDVPAWPDEEEPAEVVAVVEAEVVVEAVVVTDVVAVLQPESVAELPGAPEEQAGRVR